MTTTFRSFAKVNLHLRVQGRRQDGYHELETLFQSVDLADLITLEPGSSAVALQVTEGFAPAGEANLAHRAAVEFLQQWAPLSGVRIELQKRIPIGGGLGGGSSNAATVLLGLRHLLGRPAEVEEMMELARTLGADVPYFLVGGTVWGTGRGDQLQPLEDLPERPIWLVTPPLEISTAEVFGGLSRVRDLRPGRSEAGFAPWAPTAWETVDRGQNDLEAVVVERFPAVGDVYNVLVGAGAEVVRLSGTGSTLFAFFGESADLSELTATLPAGCRVVRTRTLTRSSLERLRVVH